VSSVPSAYRQFISASLSWLLSLLVSVVPVAAAIAIVGLFASSDTAGIVGWAVLLFGVVPWWVWTKRHYGRLPLIRLIPLGKDEIEQFREWRESRPPPNQAPLAARR
jgi:hypothetical protein